MSWVLSGGVVVSSLSVAMSGPAMVVCVVVIVRMVQGCEGAIGDSGGVVREVRHQAGWPLTVWHGASGVMVGLILIIPQNKGSGEVVIVVWVRNGIAVVTAASPIQQVSVLIILLTQPVTVVQIGLLGVMVTVMAGMVAGGI